MAQQWRLLIVFSHRQMTILLRPFRSIVHVRKYKCCGFAMLEFLWDSRNPATSVGLTKHGSLLAVDVAFPLAGSDRLLLMGNPEQNLHTHNQRSCRKDGHLGRITAHLFGSFRFPGVIVVVVPFHSYPKPGFWAKSSQNVCQRQLNYVGYGLR